MTIKSQNLSFWHLSMHLNGIPEDFLHTSCATIKAFLAYTSVLHTYSTRKRQQKNKYVISQPWSVRIEKNFAFSLECTDLTEAARSVHSKPRTKFFSIWTSRPWNNLYISLVTHTLPVSSHLLWNCQQNITIYILTYTNRNLLKRVSYNPTYFRQ